MVAPAAGIAASVASTAGFIAGAVGGSQKSVGSTQSGATSNAPWAPQQPYLTDGFANAKNICQNASAVFIPGQYVAQQNRNQANVDQQMFLQGTDGANRAKVWQDQGTALSGWRVRDAVGSRWLGCAGRYPPGPSEERLQR